MRIGIITLPLHTNYGGILQCYALQSVLERMGHDVRVLDPTQIKEARVSKLLSRLYKRYLLGRRNVDIRYESHWNADYRRRSQFTEPFVEKYIHRRVTRDFRRLDANDFDALVVGSDQIWRPLYSRRIGNAYLDFARKWPNVRRVAYAASFGTDDWEYTDEQTKLCSGLVRLFDFVSVREESGVALCRERLGVEARHALDPTLLLDAADYTRLVTAAGTPACKGNMMVYVLDQSECIRAFADGVAKARGLTPFDASANKPGVAFEQCVQPPVEQWLRGFMDAELVVTDSFHACVFSIIFNKPFICLGNKERGMSRFTSLLKMFGLEHLMVNDSLPPTEVPYVDWNEVNAIRKNKREESLRLLLSAL